jgi:hypothetical protein
MKTIVYTLALLLCCCVGYCQELDSPPDNANEVALVGYGGVDELDTDALVQRVDALTDVVNEHTDQITTLDNRLKALEGRKVAVKGSSLGSLTSTLRQPAKVSSYGSTGDSTVASVATVSSQPPLVSYGSTGGYYGTSVTYGTPVITSVSEPIITSYQPAQQNVSYDYEMNRQPDMQIQQAPVHQSQRTRTVRMPVQATTTSSTSYSPVQPGSSRLGSRLGGFLRGGGCPGGNCPR